MAEKVAVQQIMVCDPSPEQLPSICSALEGHGFQVSSCLDGKALLEQCAICVGQGSDEGLAGVQRGGAQRVFGQVRGLGHRRRAAGAWRE